MKSSKRSAVNPFLVMDVMQEASELEKQGNSIIHMEIGQPNSGAPIDALNQLYNKSLQDNLGYSSALGLPKLREKISDLYKKRYKLFIDPKRIVVTSGSSAAFVLAFTAFFDPGDKVLIGEPGYPSYKNIIKSLSLISEICSTSIENRFQLTEDSILKSTANGVLVASPANPTGVSLTREELNSLIKSAKKRKMTFISDEIYHGLNFNGQDFSALEFDEDVIVINSFSKYFSLTGWRLGWIVVPPTFTRIIEKLAQNLFICPANASQNLGFFVLNSSANFDEKVQQYRKNKDILMDHLPKLGFINIVKPDGAFYIYADISQFKLESVDLVREILEKTGVAITPGNDFDSLRGHKTVRFSFACSTNEVKEAMRRLSSWYKLYINS
ncbi:MAG: aminotransferase class I/II-fold pyridoxal phosphate-dependent enzyme [Paracoccaceae bacterium]|nr:aminotransferase class I/II-fold pyridoxal phosphate-dependent enzyme [Paracoccaceae bacterium]